MALEQTSGVNEENNRSKVLAEAQHERWAHWPVNWSAIWVGALASIAAIVVFGLIGVALGAHLVGTDHRVVDLKNVDKWTLGFSVVSAFLSFVIGGWVAGKVAGILRSEPAMLHGAITWLVALPVLVALVGFGAGSYMGGWYGGLAGTPAWAASAVPFDRPEAPAASAAAEEWNQYRTELAQYRDNVKQWRADNPRVARNSALGAVTALLLGLMGSVIGGWMACGEPMTFTYHLHRPAIPARPEQVRV